MNERNPPCILEIHIYIISLTTNRDLWYQMPLNNPEIRPHYTVSYSMLHSNHRVDSEPPPVYLYQAETRTEVCKTDFYK